MEASEPGDPALSADGAAQLRPRDRAVQAERAAIYRALTRVADVDALHELIVAKGIEVLDYPFPYLVVAARNRRRDHLRREARTERQEQTLSTLNAGPSATGSTWDPLELVMAHDELRRTLETLASMDDRDVLVVWSAAQGLSDEEIASEWDSLGLSPPHPTAAAIRKRRERAREELRRRAHIER